MALKQLEEYKSEDFPSRVLKFRPVPIAPFTNKTFEKIDLKAKKLPTLILNTDRICNSIQALGKLEMMLPTKIPLY